MATVCHVYREFSLREHGGACLLPGTKDCHDWRSVDELFLQNSQARILIFLSFM